MNRLATFVFAVALGAIAALLLCNWSVCEQDDTYCAFTGIAARWSPHPPGRRAAISATEAP